MKSSLLFLGLISLVLSFGCSSSPHKKEYKSSNVIERMGNKDKTPTWASGEEALMEQAGQILFVNAITMSGDARTEACVRAAEETGRAQMLRYIKDSLTTGGQVSELSSSGDPAVESLTAFLSQGKLTGASIASRYWEKVEESDTGGDRVLRLRCAAKVSISKSVLDRQLRAAIGNGEGNAEIREKLLNAQKDFIDGLGKNDTSSSRDTASGE